MLFHQPHLQGSLQLLTLSLRFSFISSAADGVIRWDVVGY